MPIKTKKGAKKEKVRCISPIGMFSFPHLAKPDSGRVNSDDKYKVDLLIPKARWKKEGKELMEKVLQVARDYYKDDDIELTDFKNPFKDTDKIDQEKEIDPRTKGHVLIRAKSDWEPVIVGPDAEPLDAEEIAKIKGGDMGRIKVDVYPYPNDGGGVTLGLLLVQFQQAGEALGSGRKKLLEDVGEIEVTISEPSNNEEEDETEEEETSITKKSVSKKTASKAKKKVEPEESEDEGSEEESSEEEDDVAF